MKNKETKFANMLLKRRNVYSSWKQFLKFSLKQSFIMIILIALAIAAFIYILKMEDSLVVYFIGFYVGMFAAFLGNTLSGRIIWPFAEKVINWQKVEQLADTNADTK